MPASSSFHKYSRRRLPNVLTRAWFNLLALSITSALLTMLPLGSTIVGAGILGLALLKCRIILAQYLDLATSPAWLRGFSVALTGFALIVFVLYLL
ncbi:cytochrome C oxidase subunit IV family protein [Ruegeria sp. HKCCD4884]|uniref:cytochrome C oxidase subunit IV family protein n=1 Tax=Ruegeria sp. HKCCD4884 TaxID=2683022 RepID=UPI0014922266|nr:nitric oxide reductase F protein [Ruegeria sp. HKCCD4884]